MASNLETSKPDKGPYVKDLREGMEFIGYFVGRNPRLDPFRDPGRGMYLRMQLVDRTGFIEARMWEEGDQIFEEINGGRLVKVEGVVERFREELQVNIRRMRAAREEEVDLAEMTRTTERDIDEMWEMVLEVINNITDPNLSALVRHFYADPEWIAQVLKAPSARRVHHAYSGGFLEHVYELILLARPLLDLYPELDRDLLITGILLHDIGKMLELSWGYDTDYTDEGRLLGHIVLGEREVSMAIEGIVGFPTRLALEVVHLVISHHGTYEWGSPRRPKTLEAAALHYLDNLDAQVNRFATLLADTKQNGHPWTSYDQLLRRSLYTGIDSTSLELN